jgi:hypothetical protein
MNKDQSGLLQRGTEMLTCIESGRLISASPQVICNAAQSTEQCILFG